MSRNEAKKLIRDLVHDLFAKFGGCECERAKYEAALVVLGIEPRITGVEDLPKMDDVVKITDIS